MFANNRVFFISASIIFLLVLVGAFLPEQFANVANQAQAYVGQYFGWFYLASIFCFVVFLLYLAFGKYGKIRLGPQDSTPDFSFFSWINMQIGRASCRESVYLWVMTAGVKTKK